MVAVRALLLVAAIALGLLALLGATWAVLTYTIDQPYHEMWIGLNAPLPARLRAWSCGVVAGRLGAGAGLAPYGCDGLWTPGG